MIPTIQYVPGRALRLETEQGVEVEHL